MEGNASALTVTLGEKTDQANGHIKEAVGTLAGDEAFTREGPDDRPAGDTREKFRDVQGKGDDVVFGRWTC